MSAGVGWCRCEFVVKRCPSGPRGQGVVVFVVLCVVRSRVVMGVEFSSVSSSWIRALRCLFSADPCWIWLSRV